ncbi:MAG: helix-turn-helix transcriptional regulator, partial [Candidatus Eremiobacteraeota bacterium]|nr:helix-turn-helix transcriptional regulator [Candidatus Eremiobacteraeota bacterium]
MVSNTEQNQDSISLVCDFIGHNLDQELSLESLSEVAGFSKYHFHRLFQARMGLSLYDFVQLSRLKRASYKLAFHPQDRIIDIALEAGFER